METFNRNSSFSVHVYSNNTLAATTIAFMNIGSSWKTSVSSDGWRQGKFEIKPSVTGSRLVFNAFYASIGLDNVQVTPGECAKVCK